MTYLTYLNYGTSAGNSDWEPVAKAGRKPTHGLRYSKEYTAWDHIKGRCNNPKNKQYKNYGGRGIKVCKRWLNSFELFYKDMGPAPTPAHSIDRIDVNGNYTPNNCRWSTTKEQLLNTTRNIRVTLYGRTQTITEWSIELGKDRRLVYNRLKRGWAPYKAFFTPVDTRHHAKNKSHE